MPAQFFGYLSVGGRIVRVLVKEISRGREELKLRDGGPQGTLLERESEFFEGNPDLFEELINGEKIEVDL